jgi:hypothetical protein
MGKEVVPVERIARAILVIRGEKVMLDSDLAALYSVTTGNLNKAVKRNAERLPIDLVFQLDTEEVANLKFQFGISSWGGRRRLPYAEAIRQLMAPPEKATREIGFHVREKAPRYRVRKRA